MRKSILFVGILAAFFVQSCSIPYSAGAYKVAEPARKNSQTTKPSTAETEQKDSQKTDKNANIAANQVASALVASAFASSQNQTTENSAETAKTEPKFVPTLPEEKTVKNEPQPVRSEEFTVVDTPQNTSLKTYHVVIGSFKNQSNANRLQKNMQPDYSPTIVRNKQGMYRVLVASFDTFEQADKKSRQLQNQFPDIWILIQKK